MNNPSPYLPFDTTLTFETTITREIKGVMTETTAPVEPSLLSDVFKKALIEQARTWREGHKLKKGSVFSFVEGSKKHTITLEHSVIKIEGNVYVMHHGVFAEGGQGKIKVLENLEHDTFCLVKISSVLNVFEDDDTDLLHDVLNEADIVLDAGLSQGQTQRILRTEEILLDYLFKHYSVMPHLGRDLKTHLRERDEAQTFINHELQFKLGIDMLWELQQCHSGLLFISGNGRMHRDWKLANILLGARGLRAVDFGFSKASPMQLVSPDTGTIGYFEIPFRDFMLGIYQMMYEDTYDSFDDFYEDCASDFYDEFNTIHVDDKRSGVFFDMEMARRTLYAPLRDNPRRPPTKIVLGILSPSLMSEYELDRYFDKAYSLDDMAYVAEDHVKIKDAMTLAAVLIARQVNLSHE